MTILFHRFGSLPLIAVIAVLASSCALLPIRENAVERVVVDRSVDGELERDVDGGTATEAGAADVVTEASGDHEDKEGAEAVEDSQSAVVEEVIDPEVAAELKAQKLREREERLQPELDLGLAMVHAGENERALEHYETLVEQEPEAFVVHYNLGLLRDRIGDTEGARAAYRRVLELEPDYAPASENLVRSLLRDGAGEEAEQLLRDRLEERSEDLALRNQLVRVLLVQGHHEEAEAEAKRILTEDERNVSAMLHLASLWHGQGKFELVRQVLENAREIEPDNAVVWNRLAFAQMELDHRRLALESFRKAAELQEDYAEAHNNLGAMLNEANDCDAAVAALENAARWAPSNSQIRLNLGNAYRCARRFADAETEYRKALELDDGMEDAWFNLAILYLDGDFDEVDTAERLRTSLAHFGRYQEMGGDDSRLDRYTEEAQTALGREEARLARVAERERIARERAEREAAKRREEEERIRRAAQELRERVEPGKLATKSAVEDDPEPAVFVPPPYAVTKIADGGK